MPSKFMLGPLITRVLREENRAAMCRTGRVYRLRRRLEDLPTEGRPLSQAERLEEMERRLPTVVLPLPGIPTSTRFVLSRQSRAVMASVSSSGMDLSKNSSSAQLRNPAGAPRGRGSPH